MHRQKYNGLLTQRILWLVIGVCACLFLMFGNAYQVSRLGFDSMFPQGDPDVLMHLRRVEQCLISGGDLEIVSQDQYSGFPRSYFYPYAPFLDSLCVHTCRVYYYLFPGSEVTFDRVVAWVPILFGGLFVLIFSTWLAFLTGSASMGVLSGFFLASNPSFTSLFLYHSIDHHFLESFFLWVWVIFGSLVSCSKGFSGSIAIGGAVTWCLLIFSWTGTPLLASAFFMLAVVARFLYPAFQGHAQYVAYSFVISGGVAAILCFSSINTFWHHFYFSMFQPVFTLCAGLGIVVYLKTYELRPFCRFAVWSVASLSILGLFFLKFGDPIGYLAGSHPILQSIDELQSVFSRFLETFMIRDLMKAVDWKLVFFPFAVAVAMKSFPHQQTIWLCFPAFFVFFLGFWQVRYLRWSAAFFTLGQSLVLGHILAKVGFSGGGSWRRRLFNSLMGLPFLFLSVAGIMESSPSGVHRLYEPVVKACLWLGRNTPDPGGYSDNSVPSYGVLSYWDLGNYISYYARRPAVCDNLQRGLGVMSRVFLAENPEDAYQLMSEGKIRYLLISALSPFTTGVLLPQLKASYFHGDGAVILEKPQYSKSDHQGEQSKIFYLSLFRHLGMGDGGALQPLSRLRLVYVSYERDNTEGIPPVTLFEYVKGAQLEGRTAPGASFSVSLDLSFSMYKMKRQFRLEGRADSEGRFSVRVPYPTSTYSGGIETGPSYRLMIGKADGKKLSQEIEISSEAVNEGRKCVVGENGLGDGFK